MLIFGNPKGGTPLMAQKPTVGLDLPLKALVWQDSDGKTWLGYNDPLESTSCSVTVWTRRCRRISRR